MDFGEIIVNPGSRAFWSDYEDIPNEPLAPAEEFIWIWSNPTNENADQQRIKQCEHFIFIEGKNFRQFINRAILNETPMVCKLNAPTNNKNQKVEIYLFDNSMDQKNMALCVIENSDLNQFGGVTEALIPFLSQAKYVNCISIQPNVQHKGTTTEDANKFCFIRSINSKFSDISELTEPNYLTGVIAGVSTWRKFSYLPFSCYVVYTDSVEIDGGTAGPILDLLKRLGVSCNQSYKSKAVDSLLYT